LSDKLKHQQPKETRMQFTVGDVLTKERWYMAPYTVSKIEGGRIRFKGYARASYSVDDQELIVISRAAPANPAKPEGAYEPCSEYRACQDERGNWLVEASRVKIIATASDKDEAERIANALNKVRNEEV
jgi:hypothetical protein